MTTALGWWVAAHASEPGAPCLAASGQSLCMCTLLEDSEQCCDPVPVIEVELFHSTPWEGFSAPI